MSFRDSRLEDLKVPLTWTASAALAVAILVAAMFLLRDRRDDLDTRWGETRAGFDQIAAPAGEVVSAPIRWTGGAFGWVGDYFNAVGRNRRLEAENRALRKWRDTAIALKDVNERYETLLRLRTDPPAAMVAARIVADTRGPTSNTRLANAGSEKGVRPGHPVMSEHGLVGRVVGVTKGASRVLLLTDPASRTPILIDRTNARAILTGDGGPNPRLEFLRGVQPTREGDTILTSGDGGVFPRGLPVGVAVRGLDGVWRARLYSDRSPIDYVRILQFQDFTRLVNEASMQTALPPVVAPTTPPPPPVTVP
ncbi:MAG: rod shape-determining protein MreC, partial [Pseudomonadota bacterium]|nr:rod shape-determining protein MreC [Pseudomonadota bacterium]